VVFPGDEVTKGQKIAEIGASGNANVNHLHFSVWGATYNNNVDPWSGACGRMKSLWDSDPLLLGEGGALIANFKEKVPVIKKTKSLRRLLDKIIVKYNKGKSICTKLDKVSKKIDKLIKKKKIEENLGLDLITDLGTLKPYLGC
jgi:murein DD-endopeptidase MepM/ murein hydrolase activator NlpD